MLLVVTCLGLWAYIQKVKSKYISRDSCLPGLMTKHSRPPTLGKLCILIIQVFWKIKQLILIDCNARGTDYIINL